MSLEEFDYTENGAELMAELILMCMASVFDHDARLWSKFNLWSKFKNFDELGSRRR